MINRIENRVDEKKQRRELSLEQIAVIVSAQRLSKKISSDYPEIADYYKQGNTVLDILESYNLAEEYRSNPMVANLAVQRALAILIPKEERLILKKQHQQKSGQKTYEKNIGIFSLSTKELKDAGRKGGVIGGKKSSGGIKTYQMRKGIHTQSNKEKREFSMIGVVARGLKPYSEEEKRYFFELCEDLKYQHSIKNKGEPNYNLISEELQKKFGIKRSAHSLHNRMYKFRKGTK